MMKTFKLVILVTVITLIFSLGVSAKEDTFRASVEKLLILMKQDQTIEQAFPQMKQLMQQQLQQMNIPQEQSPIIEKYLNKMFDVMKEEMSWNKMRDDYIQVYMSVYTEKEIQELIAFYKTPIGQKMVEKMPLLLEQSMTISQKYAKNMIPKIQEITQEMITEGIIKSQMIKKKKKKMMKQNNLN